MECVLLGTGGMMPMPYRMLASMALKLQGRIYIFDAGEGTQLGVKKARIGLRGFNLVAVTHLHADHCLGLPGLMMLRAQMEHPGPLTILGPPGIASFVQENQRLLEFHLNYPVIFTEWHKGCSPLAFEDEGVRLFWAPLAHTRFCLGYRLEEKERPGKFHPGKADELGIPQGPLWGALQAGRTILLESGRHVTPDEVMGTPRRGRHVAYVVDTRPTDSILWLCRNADLAVLEGMFLPEDSRHAEAKGHLTAVDAAQLAARAAASRVVLTHISPRYQEADLLRLEEAARTHFPAVTVGRDLEVHELRWAE